MRLQDVCRDWGSISRGDTNEKANPDRLAFSILVAPRESSSASKDSGLCDFRHSPGLCLHHSFHLRWVPFSLYTFNSAFALKLGSALP
jgi:hypothetical protein